VVGLRGQSDKDLVAWMESAIIGAQSVYPSLRERRVLGAVRTPIESADELGLRPGSGYLLYAIQTQAELTAAGEQLIIANANEGNTAQRPQEIVLFIKE
jgi:type VI secretion system protein ImpJ